LQNFKCRLRLASFLVAIFCFSILSKFSTAEAIEMEARAVITEAEVTVRDCYFAAVEAERAGANVTDLLAILNDAGMLLSKAQLAFEKRDFDSAVNYAEQSRTKLGDFVSKANVLKEAATQERHWDFMVNISGSTIGTVAIISVSLAVWFHFEKREKAGKVAE